MLGLVIIAAIFALAAILLFAASFKLWPKKDGSDHPAFAVGRMALSVFIFLAAACFTVHAAFVAYFIFVVTSIW